MKIGILGAGQLGRMLALAGYRLDFDFVFLDPAPEACAAPLGEHLHAGYSDQHALAAFCRIADIATYEFENVPDDAAAFVGARIPLRPGAAALAAGQDRCSEKTLFGELGIPVPGWARVDTRDDLERALAQVGMPAMLKTRRLGYDGKGQHAIRSREDADAAWARLGGGPLILESFVAFEREVSIIAVRGHDGATAFYPITENEHRDGILRRAVPRLADPLQRLGEEYARRVLERLEYVGVLAFEFFAVGAGLLANEIAPRVHNSGHWTIDGAVCSQFENHLRAIAGLPLGDTSLRGPCAMLNFIGSAPDATALAAIPGVQVHLYGKTPKPQRKVGHATVLAADAVELARRVARLEQLLAE